MGASSNFVTNHRPSYYSGFAENVLTCFMLYMNGGHWTMIIDIRSVLQKDALNQPI